MQHLSKADVAARTFVAGFAEREGDILVSAQAWREVTETRVSVLVGGHVCREAGDGVGGRRGRGRGHRQGWRDQG